MSQTKNVLSIIINFFIYIRSDTNIKPSYNQKRYKYRPKKTGFDKTSDLILKHYN